MTDSDYIAIGAAIVSFCAFGATIWQGILARRHNRLSVRPHINILNEGRPHANGVSIKITVVNVGLGPAVVTDASFFIEGRRVEFEEERMQMVEILRLIYQRKLEYSIAHHGALANGAVLAPGDAHVLLGATFPSVRYEDTSILDEYSKSVSYILKYKSFYGENFESDLSRHSRAA